MEDIIFFTVFLLSILGLGVLILTQGMIQLAPLNIAVRRNQITGKMVELTPFPALRFFLPGIYHIFRVMKCQKVVHDPDFVKVTTRDGQEVEVDYILTLWPDRFNEDGTLNPDKEGNVIKLAIILEPEKIVGAIKDHTHAAIQRMFGHIESFQLLKNQKIIKVLCPDCGQEISNKDRACPNDTCPQHSKNIPGGFYNRLGWAVGVRLDDFLDEKYGLACWLEIQSVRYVGDLRKAARAETMGKMEGLATKARLGHETKAMKNLFDETGVSPTFGFAFTKIAEVVPEIVNLLTKKKGDKDD